MRYLVEKDLPVSTRDGVTLATDVWMVEGRGASPAILVRSPYSKDAYPLLAHATAPSSMALLEAGYALVFQDCRGTGKSAGVFAPMLKETEDAHDTLTWIATQDWCDGRIGMAGASYLGFTQWAAEASDHPALRAVAPAFTSPDMYLAPWFSPGGARSEHAGILWSAIMAASAAARAAADGDAGAADDLGAILAHIGELTPVASSEAVATWPGLRRHAPWLEEWMAHPARDEYWTSRALEPRDTPALRIAGWFDVFVDSAVRSFRADAGQHLVIGPWDHTSTNGLYPSIRFGPSSDSTAADLTSVHRAFFDRWVRGDDSASALPPVRIFVMGANAWRDEPDWPLPDTQYTEYYLADGGRLLPDPAASDSATLRADPANPVPTVGGRTLLPAAAGGAGPADQSTVESRDDVLVFTSEPLESPLEVTGRVTLVLPATPSTVDADVVGRLVDVHPDGRAIPITEGVLRARFRTGPEAPVWLKPGVEVELVVDLSVTSNLFLHGHRLRLDIAGSSFPHWDVNSNSADAAQPVRAATTLRLGGLEGARLVLPVIPLRD